MAGMDLKRLRENYPTLFLAGGIDVSQLLPFGTPVEVEAACFKALSDTGEIGYFIGSTTELQNTVPLGA